MAGATITDAPIKEMTIPVWDYTWWDRLLRRPKQRTFQIHLCRVCNMERSATIAHMLPELINKTGDFKSMEEMTATIYPLVFSHKKDLVYLIAACIQNNWKEPKKSLIRYIDRNFSGEDLLDAAIYCISQSCLSSFYSAILIVKGTSAVIATDTVAAVVNTPE